MGDLVEAVETEQCERLEQPDAEQVLPGETKG